MFIESIRKIPLFLF